MACRGSLNTLQSRRSGWMGGTSVASRPPACARRAAAKRAPPQAGLFDDMFNFEKWAPKSAQAWRYGKANFRQELEARSASSSIDQESVDLLNERLASARQAEPSGAGVLPPDDPPTSAAGTDARPAAAYSSSNQQQEQEPSFLRSTDDELADALNARIGQLGSRDGGGSEGEDEDEQEQLSGQMLKTLIYDKYGFYYDVSFARRDLPLGKVLVCLNIMWVHAEQRSFPMTEEEFDDKMDSVAFYLNAWGQSQRVLDFLRSPAKPRKGMPSKPIVGCAISIQLDLSPQVIEEFFSQGGS